MPLGRGGPGKVFFGMKGSVSRSFYRDLGMQILLNKNNTEFGDIQPRPTYETGFRHCIHVGNSVKYALLMPFTAKRSGREVFGLAIFVENEERRWRSIGNIFALNNEQRFVLYSTAIISEVVCESGDVHAEWSEAVFRGEERKRNAWTLGVMADRHVDGAKLMFDYVAVYQLRIDPNTHAMSLGPPLAR